ncbi:MAG: heme-copper oxidase subunit III [Anaerolineales bacterium]|nr:heme-copper oxidase subunit III [Anaerolineales bacterium]
MTAHSEVETTQTYNEKLSMYRLGLWLFILSDAFVFGALFITRFFLMGGARPDVEQGVGLIVTVILLLSSFFMNRAEIQMSFGDTKGFLRNVGTTFILGLIFLIGVVGVEWQIAPFGPADGAQGAIYYSMTAFHAFHVLTGLILLGVVYNNGRNGVYTKERHWAVEAAAVYWHFIDVVWIFFYPALYLIGFAVG